METSKNNELETTKKQLHNKTETIEKQANNNKKTLLTPKNNDSNENSFLEEQSQNKENNKENNEEKTALETFLEQEGFNDLEEIQSFDDLDLEEGGNNETPEEEDLGFDPEELDDIPEGNDLFGEVVDGDGEEPEPRTQKAKEIKEKLTSSKNGENLQKLSLLAMGKVDLVKAKLCSKISGQHFAKYIGDDETLEILIEVVKEYLAEKEFTEPSPFAALMFALAMWTLPPLGMAALERFEVFDLLEKKPKEQAAPKTNTNNSTPEKEQEPEQEVQGEAASDQPTTTYAHLKEFQDKRKEFSLNASGKYKRTPDGKTYIKVEHADEYPSSPVKEWIEEGKTNREIRKLLDYGE